MSRKPRCRAKQSSMPRVSIFIGSIAAATICGGPDQPSAHDSLGARVTETCPEKIFLQLIAVI